MPAGGAGRSGFAGAPARDGDRPGLPPHNRRGWGAATSADRRRAWLRLQAGEVLRRRGVARPDAGQVQEAAEADGDPEGYVLPRGERFAMEPGNEGTAGRRSQEADRLPELALPDYQQDGDEAAHQDRGDERVEDEWIAHE